MLCHTLLSISSEPRRMERIMLASMENFYVTISASPPIPIYSGCQDPFWAAFFQSTPYWFRSPPSETCGTYTDSSGSREKAVPSSFEKKSHHVCLMRNVSGRKVLSAAKQIFYFFHIKSSISSTPHPGSSCPEERLRPVPISPAGYCLFPANPAIRTVPVSGHHSQAVTHLSFLLQAAIQLSSDHKGIPHFLLLMSLSRSCLHWIPTFAILPPVHPVIYSWSKASASHVSHPSCSLALKATKVVFSL